jgi:hypothetical protein
LYSIVECLNFNSSVCFWWLAILTAGALYAKTYGFLNLGIDKALDILKNGLKSKTVANDKEVLDMEVPKNITGIKIE